MKTNYLTKYKTKEEKSNKPIDKKSSNLIRKLKRKTSCIILKNS